MILLTPSEESVMFVMWKLNSAYMRDIMNAYPEPKPHQNTVSTFLKNLVEKKFLTTTQEGRIFHYTVHFSESEYKRQTLKNFVDQYYNGVGFDLLKGLLSEKLIDAKEIEKLISLTEKTEKKEGKKKKKKKRKE
ncbi:MAG: BlaI/MecI/CopY family transcriptional regulator [Cloacibacterium sp.]|jgi:predicted transcriptional regulator|nr:BlaI/MecI/CopY family transcriptional regulator [Cloacibacterium sp.]